MKLSRVLYGNPTDFLNYFFFGEGVNIMSCYEMYTMIVISCRTEKKDYRLEEQW